MTRPSRFRASYIASLDDLPQHEDWHSDKVQYTTIYGTNLDKVIDEAKSNDINGEVYLLSREVWRELGNGDGIYDWCVMTEIDPVTKQERWV